MQAANEVADTALRCPRTLSRELVIARLDRAIQ
jgi:hypothetical protein